MRGAWYNEPDRQKAATLRHLIEEGAIAHGVVDERPIQAIQPEDVADFVQCHFFAGGGVWSYSARLAGWPDDRPLWTGSCPCGPFSRAGLQKGFEDPRHLWPEWFRLIRVRRPHCIFGEQSADADAWLDLVATDLESIGYAFGSPDLPAAGFGGAHIRQRFDWVADTDNAEWWSDRAPWNDGDWPKTGRVQGDRYAGNGSSDGGLADAYAGGQRAAASLSIRDTEYHAEPRGDAGGLGHAGRDGSAALSGDHGEVRRLSEAQRQSEYGAALSGRPGPLVGVGYAPGWGPQGGTWERGAGQWLFQRQSSPSGDADWLRCRDAVWRPVESGTCPLVDETTARMGRLRLYGDAVDAEQTAQFIGAYLDAAPARVAA